MTRKASGIKACSSDQELPVTEKSKGHHISGHCDFGSTVMYHCLRECFSIAANNEKRGRKGERKKKNTSQ
jgi:hypothetical protein